MANNNQRSSIPGAFLWMLFLSILLCWLPGIGQFIAGFVGGKKAGNVRRALAAFALPAIVFSLLFIFIFPLIPFIGIGMATLLVIGNFALFCGAIVGGALA
ncbi:MAG: hypothetical protein GY863_08545 [bacterium]|nr:hypothetical protein [bacterium]